MKTYRKYKSPIGNLMLVTDGEALTEMLLEKEAEALDLAGTGWAEYSESAGQLGEADKEAEALDLAGTGWAEYSESAGQLGEAENIGGARYEGAAEILDAAAKWLDRYFDGEEMPTPKIVDKQATENDACAGSESSSAEYAGSGDRGAECAGGGNGDTVDASSSAECAGSERSSAEYAGSGNRGAECAGGGREPYEYTVEVEEKLLLLRPDGTEFRREVWKMLCEIPYGQVTTYGSLAKRMAKIRGKSKMSAQAVGGAVGHNPISIMIPCHRVIGADGSLVGFGGGIPAKEWLLKKEGVGDPKVAVATG